MTGFDYLLLAEVKGLGGGETSLESLVKKSRSGYIDYITIPLSQTSQDKFGIPSNVYKCQRTFTYHPMATSDLIISLNGIEIDKAIGDLDLSILIIMYIVSLDSQEKEIWRHKQKLHPPL